MPESTIAIAGGFASVPLVTSAQPRATPETNGHCCRLERLPVSWTGTSCVIAKTSFFVASLRSCLPVTCAETPPTVAKRRFTPSALPGSSRSVEVTALATSALFAFDVAWTMTENVRLGSACAALRRPCGTNAEGAAAPAAARDVPAPTDASIASAATSTTRTVRRLLSSAAVDPRLCRMFFSRFRASPGAGRR